MADEKKPKIDLKARLGKTQVGAQAPPAGGLPAPTPAPPPAGRGVAGPPPTPTPGPALPIPPGVPVGGPQFGGSSSAAGSIDPSNPLSAGATPYRAPAPPPH